MSKTDQQQSRHTALRKIRNINLVTHLKMQGFTVVLMSDTRPASLTDWKQSWPVFLTEGYFRSLFCTNYQNQIKAGRFLFIGDWRSKHHKTEFLLGFLHKKCIKSQRVLFGQLIMFLHGLFFQFNKNGLSFSGGSFLFLSFWGWGGLRSLLGSWLERIQDIGQEKRDQCKSKYFTYSGQSIRFFQSKQ